MDDLNSRRTSRRPARPRPLTAAALLGLLAWVLRAAAQGPAPLTTTPSLSADTDRKYHKTCLSAGCHEPQTHPGEPLHPPFREGRCLVCHDDHATSQPHLIKAGGDALCLSCHTGMTLTTATQTLAHPAGGQHCTQCHNPHQSRERNLLRGKEQLLSCAGCHADFLAKMAKQPYRHHYLDPKTECGSCHYAHRRPGQHYLRENVSETCLTCHDLKIGTAGHVLENVADRINRAPVVHGAVKQGACPACHTPHGSPQPSLLKPGYPAGSYETYRSEQYAVCWQCHAKALAENPHGSGGVTSFRNGDQNLHFLHVTRLKRGRACHLCHEAHAADAPHLLRETVRFGQWNAPLVYKPADGGGSCQTPCHRERQYSRDQAVKQQ